MKQKLLTILLSMIMLFTSPIYAKDDEKDAIPGRAIFVMAPDYPIHVQSKAMNTQNKTINSNIKVPQIKGLKNKKFEGELNKCFLKEARTRKKQFTKEAQINASQSQNLGVESKTYELIRNFTVKQTVEPYIVVGIFEYRYTGGAHGISERKYWVINKESNEVITLKDLFKQGVDYQALINEQIMVQIPNKKAVGTVFYDDIESVKTRLDEKTFYIDQKGNLVVVFNVYEIAPYISGTIEFTIQKQTIEKFLENNMEGA